MQNIFRIAVALAALTAIATASRAQTPNGVIQDIPEELRQDRYVTGLIETIDQWNQSNLDLGSKESLRPSFETRLDQNIEIQAYPYETPGWKQKLLHQFDDLPQRVVPSRRLDQSAELVLVLLFLKDRNDFELHIPVGSMRDVLRLPLFLILGRAEAMAAKNVSITSIDAHLISKSTLDWWTAVWPFCK